MAASVCSLIQIVKKCNFTANCRKVVLVQDKEEMSSSIWNTMYMKDKDNEDAETIPQEKKNCVP